MKKLISVAAALGLVAGVATTASAMDFSVSGMYQLEGYYLDSANGAGFIATDDEAGSMSGWVHTFLMKPTLKVNDKISMMSDIRFLKDTDYGTAGAQDTGIKSSHRAVDIHKIYMEYMSPIGKIRAGRTAAAAWQGAFLNSPTNGDRIYLFPKMDAPWSSYVFLQKGTENDWSSSDNDADYDVYEASIGYTTKETKWALGYNFFNDKTMSGIDGDVKTAASTHPDTGVHTPAVYYAATDEYDRQRHRVKGYVKQTMADLWVEAEVSYDFGDWKDFDDATVEDHDVDTLAAMAAVGTSFDNLKVSALYFYGSGDDDATDDDMEAAFAGAADAGSGDGFNPYYILTGDHTGMLNSDEYAANPLMAQMGVHSIGISADLAVSDKLTLHGAVAYAMAAEDQIKATGAQLYTLGVTSVDGVATKGDTVTVYDADIDDEYGWEINLGASYKLLDNLTYEARAGYFVAGDFFKDVADAMGQDEEDLLLLSHHLTMTF